MLQWPKQQKDHCGTHQSLHWPLRPGSQVKNTSLQWWVILVGVIRGEDATKSPTDQGRGCNEIFNILCACLCSTPATTLKIFGAAGVAAGCKVAKMDGFIEFEVSSKCQCKHATTMSVNQISMRRHLIGLVCSPGSPPCRSVFRNEYVHPRQAASNERAGAVNACT